MTYNKSRVRYGDEGWQWMTQYAPSGHTPGVDPDLPVIIFSPGGGWGDQADLTWEDHSVGQPVYYAALNDDQTAYHETFVCFVLHDATLTQNAQAQTAFPAWATSTAYREHEYVYHHPGGTGTVNVYRVKEGQGHTSSASDEPGVGGSWATFWDLIAEADVPAIGKVRPWVDGADYVSDDYVVAADSNYYTALQDHTSVSATDEPGSGSSWTDFWREVYPNETWSALTREVGESTPAFLDQGILDVHTAIAHLRRNQSTYGIDKSRICVMGASSGGQKAGAAAYWYTQPWAGAETPWMGARDVPNESTRPNAVILAITPTDLRPYTAVSLLTGLWGVDYTDSEYQALPSGEKGGLSPMGVLERTGAGLPTYLSYPLTYYNDAGAGTEYGTPTYHHAIHGWNLLGLLTDAAPTGLARSDCVYVEDDPASGDLRRWTSQTSSTTTVTSTAAAQAADVLDWLNTVMP